MKLLVTVALGCIMCGDATRGQALLAGAAPTVAATGATTLTPTGASVGAGVFRSSVDLVSLNVLATDPKDKFVTGLGERDFAVFEDGVQQDVTFFEAEDMPLDLAILLDTSASMADHLSTVQEAAVGFASHLRQGDRVAVIDIQGDARMLHPLDEDIAGACEAIRHTTAGGGTALYNAIYITIKQMQKVHERERDFRREAIAVLSDGNDTVSLVTFDDLLALAKQADVAIYTITLKSPYAAFFAGNQKYVDESDYGMRALAKETGARSFFPTEIGQLGGVYDTITEELANEYAMGYMSKNPRRDGGYRRILVRVAEPNVRIRTRAGYQAAAPSRQIPVR